MMPYEMADRSDFSDFRNAIHREELKSYSVQNRITAYTCCEHLSERWYSLND